MSRTLREALRRLAPPVARRLALLLTAVALAGPLSSSALAQTPEVIPEVTPEAISEAAPDAPPCPPIEETAAAAGSQPPCAPAPEVSPSEEAPEPPHPPDGTLIGEVIIIPKGIFDPNEPGENKKIFRFADRLHRATRPKVIERQLLFKSGDAYSREAVEESERILRANRYLYDADIRPVRQEDGRVDLEVVTRDVWTLRAGASLNRAGGENSTNFSLEDSNFLGTGKDLTIWRISNVDRTSTLFRFRDPHLYGQHLQLEASYADYSDGGSRRFELERPFYSLDARWTAGFKSWSFDRVDSLYDRGEVFQKFDHGHDFLEIFGGLSPGLQDGATRRLRIGFTHQKDTFNYSPGGDSTPEPPQSRTLAYPWIGFDYIEDGFVVARDLDRIQRTEDLNLGRQFQSRIGWTSPSFGGDENQAIGSASFTAGWSP
ncbi:MAG TPA: POTRA domain-containing protein, partial [Thermoanaerobaculia bacterium]|nr:POTRA domain-containing protein [Thermoanaerobaculia bacterium]